MGIAEIIKEQKEIIEKLSKRANIYEGKDLNRLYDLVSEIEELHSEENKTS